jgi:hypothetical protein
VKIVQAGIGIRGADTFSPVSAVEAKALFADCYRAIGLYASVTSPETIANCLGAGLGIWWILEGVAASTVPTAAIGQAQAVAAMTRLHGLGVPLGYTLSSDLEGRANSPQAWIDYGNAIGWATKIAGNIPAMYCGAGIGLTSAELMAMAPTRYWKSASKVVDRFAAYAEPSCGWATVQGSPLDIVEGGLQIDVDFIFHDYEGRTFSLVVA